LEATGNTYVSYSNFKVGAAILVEDGTISIILAKNNKNFIVKTLDDVLPGAFTKIDLNK